MPTLPTMELGPFTSRPALAGYALVPQSFLVDVHKRFGTIEAKVKLIEKGFNPWVDRRI